MKNYTEKIKAKIGIPKLDVLVSNPFPLINENVTLSSFSKWIDNHEYTTNNGEDNVVNITSSVLGRSSKEIQVKRKADITQSVSASNASGNVKVDKTIYIMEPAVEPYFDVAVSKEIVRNDGESTRIILEAENGYSFTREYDVVVRVYKENEESLPLYTLTKDRFYIENGKLISDELIFDIRGIYDIETDLKDIQENKTFYKRINKLITVTPKLAVRSEAIEFLMPNAKLAASPEEYTINGDDYPKGSTIVLKYDPRFGEGYPVRLKLNNFKSTWDNPYIITIDQNSPFVMNWFYYWGINVGGASEHLVFDGRGYQNISKGIRMVAIPGEQATAAISAGELSHELEFFEVEIDGSGFAGFFIKTDPNPNSPETWYDNFKFNRLLLHHNYVHNTDGEGSYLGHYNMAPYTGKNNDGQTVTYRAHHLYNCRFYRCLYENNGYDNLQFCNAEDLEICYNRFFSGGLRGETDQASGLSLGMSGKIYNNIVTGFKGPSIQFSTLARIDIFNNILANGYSGYMGLLLLATYEVPEQNPNNQGYNELPTYIYNNIILTENKAPLTSRNTSQYRNVHFSDNFCIATTKDFLGGQSAETVELWKKNAKGNVLMLQGYINYSLTDQTYKFGDCQNSDFRIAADSPLIQGGSGSLFKFDFRGYKNWYQNEYPVGPYMGIYRSNGVDERFRVLSVVFDDDVIQTINSYIFISWTFYGIIPLKEYRISEDQTFTDVAWLPYDVEDGGQYRYDFSGNKGERIIYLQLKNQNDEITNPFGKNITWISRTALIGINSTPIPNTSGIFNSDTGITYVGIKSKPASTFNFKDILGNNYGTIGVNYTYSVSNGIGNTTGDNSGLYPDVVLQNNEQVVYTTSTGVIGDPKIFTININPGVYKIGIFTNSNMHITKPEQLAHLEKITKYWNYNVNGVINSAIVMINNFETMVEMNNIIVGEDRILTITGYWNQSVVTDVPGLKGLLVYGAINLIKIEEM